jgi:hypothetical protein
MTMTIIKCGNCQGFHGSVNEVRDCHKGVTVSEYAAVATIESTPVAPVRMASEKQIEFIANLRVDRMTDEMIFAPVDRLTSQNASDLIKKLLELPKRETSADPTSAVVPEGYYAVPSVTGNNDLDFFMIQRPTDGKWSGYTFLKRVVGGHADLPVRKADVGRVLRRIEDYGVKAAGMLYATEIGRCYRCNRHLTDDASRAAGMGPHCRTL